MKKILPLILLLVGVLVLVGAFVFTKMRKPSDSMTPEDEEAALIDVPLEQRPVVYLTPREDGHWLDMTVEKLMIDAATVDYELLYTLPDGRIQGVPGTQKLDGKTKLEVELLLGSESAGKFRYDEGVETGSMTLKFRNDKGKLVAKFKTEFHLQTETTELSSIDGVLSATLDDDTPGFFISMDTIGYPDGLGFVPTGDPYGIFSSESSLPGTISFGSGNVMQWNGNSWSASSSENILGVYASQ